MVVLSNDSQIDGVVKHVGKGFRGQESSTDESVLRRIPERVIFLV